MPEETGYKRSPFFYVGDKYKLIPQLEANFPKDIDRFIEPFCGGGSVFLNTRANSYLLNDIDSHMVGLHKFLMSYSGRREQFWSEARLYIDKYGLSATFLGKDVPPEYRKKFVKTYFAKYNKEAYTKLRAEFNRDQNDMMQLYLLLIYGFNRMLRFNSKGDFNLPVGNVDFNSNVVDALNAYFDYVDGKSIKIFDSDFQEFIGMVSPTPNDMVYLDPPYLITFSEYNKLWNEDSEQRLIACLDELDSKNVRFAVSNVIRHKERYNAAFDAWAQKYNIVRIKSNYISYHDNSEKGSYEVLVKNY